MTRLLSKRNKSPDLPPVDLAAITDIVEKIDFQAITSEVNVPVNDPLYAYILNNPGVIDLNRIDLESPILRELRTNNIRMVVPLISRSEILGLINVGQRMSEADYSIDDRRMLGQLALQASPALRVAQLARQQQLEAQERERMEQELRVARVIQQTLLPKEVPEIPGYVVSAYWQPARIVAGDFYDFITFSDGKIAFIIGDVTDKGVPAALVMATTRSILRSTAEHLVSPGAVLEQANNLLRPDIPANMFITCLYALFDPASGKIRYANAGHNVPYLRRQDQVLELRARGMPLGLMSDMTYEEKEAQLEPGDYLVFYTDGLIEAHNLQGEMFGSPQLRKLITIPVCGKDLIACLLDELKIFTGAEWEQEDDVTFVTLERLNISADGENAANVLTEFSVPSQPGNERKAMEMVVSAIKDLGLEQVQIDHLKTAVSEATMNAMEHGNHYDPDLPVDVTVSATSSVISVKIHDLGGAGEFPAYEEPDLEAKLAGLQSPRGWGLFLIQKMVDDMQVSVVEGHHTVELIMNRKGK